MGSETKAFLPGIGFRRAGMRLAAPVSIEHGERTLTVQQLVATPEATDLIYDVTCLPGDASPAPLGQIDRVVLHDGASEYGVGGGMHIAVRTGKLVRGFTMVPLPLGTRRVELRVAGPSIGEWAIPLDLVLFPSRDDERYVPVDATDARDGITVAVRGMVANSHVTALDLMALAERPTVRIQGLGGMHGMRDAATALTLHDQAGRGYVEQVRPDARDQFPDPSGISDVAIFDPLSDDAQELVLEVPSVCYDDEEPRVDIDLPVAAPVSAMFGTYPIRVLASGDADASMPWHRGPAVTLELDLGGWQGERRILKPLRVDADGQTGGYSFGRGMRAPDPEPLDHIEIPRKGERGPQRLTFIGATIQARGPWRVRFHRPT